MEQRYQIGSISRYGIFQCDTLGNDPDDTTFASEEEAIQALQSLIEQWPELGSGDALTDAAVWDSEDNRIVWQQPEIAEAEESGQENDDESSEF
jgi:hypothetical protein